MYIYLVLPDKAVTYIKHYYAYKNGRPRTVIIIGIQTLLSHGWFVIFV